MTIEEIKLFFVLALCFSLSDAQQQNRCQNEPDGNMFPVPERSSYVECRNRQEQVRNCRPGFEFDPFARKCEPLANRAAGASVSSRNPCTGQPDGTYLADPSSRNRFFYCINGESLAGNCPSNEYFYVDSASCSASNLARPAAPPRSPPSATRAPPNPRGPTATTTAPSSRPRPPAPARPSPQNYQRQTRNGN